MQEMKPAFALDFRDATLGLLHRTGAGWTQLGIVALDDPDLTQALGYLRATALGLSPRGISTKLIIPNDQILYLTLAAPGPDAAKRRAQIAAALEGRTPYEVADLVFDWSGAGAEVRVAVIARETLAEAASFAAEHRFNPVSFVAVPDEGTFKGEPWFGPTDMAAELLAAGEKVDRDKVAVTITSRAPVNQRPAAAAPVVAKAPTPEPPKPDPVAVAVKDDPAPEPLPAPPPTSVAAPPLQDLPPFRAEDLPMRAAPPRSDPAPDTVSPRAAPAVTDDAPETMSFAQIMAEARAELPVPPLQPQPVALSPAPAVSPAPLDALYEAPMALDVQGDDADDPKPASVLNPNIIDDLPDPSPSALIAFSSRRQAGDNTGFGASAKTPANAAAPSPSTVPRPAMAKPLPSAGAGYDRATLPPIVARPNAATTPPRPPTAGGKSSATTKALRGLGALVTAPGIAGSAVRKPPVPQIAGASQSQTSPAAKPNAAALPARVPPPRPGIGLGGKQAPVRGKPRYMGLILTVLLLLCLAAVAAWSSFSLASWNNGSGPATAVVDATADPAIEPLAEASADVGSSTSDFPAPEDEMAADMQDPADFAAADADAAALATALADNARTEQPAADLPAAEVEAAADLPPPPAEPAPETGLTAALADGNNPNPEPQDEILLATMDAPPVAPDPLSLPKPEARGDPQPASPPPPPPFGTVYKFDADGQIIPTPEGIMTPEGVLLIAGKPPVVPAVRPAALSVAQGAVAPTDPALATLEPATAAPLATDPALVGKRSKPRPAALAPAALPDDDAALAPATDSRFAGLRPRLRPAEMLAAGDAARIASASASLVATTEDDQADLLVAASSRSPMAVAISRKPEARPRDLSRAVEAAVAAAVRAPDPAPEEQTAAAAQPEKDASPEADNEPELASAAPNIPTKASVAKQATFKNAINLSKINLIGVYGTQSSRYALVRQANGRYKKVKVGDRIDGGQIAAITATEVRYKKGSKMLTLALPKS